jgi:hypothetical protein
VSLRDFFFEYGGNGFTVFLIVAGAYLFVKGIFHPALSDRPSDAPHKDHRAKPIAWVLIGTAMILWGGHRLIPAWFG